MLSKATCRYLLLRYKKYVKLSVFCNEFGLSSPKLSMFLRNEAYDKEISLQKINDFVVYVQNSLYEIVT